MKKNYETLIDEKGIEIAVGYCYEITPSQTEECHGYHEVGNLTFTELQYVEVIIKGAGIDILPMLSENQKKAIINELQYD